MKIKAVLFDLIGTTVTERDPDTLNNCFINALAENGITAVRGNIIKHRGKDKKNIINSVLNELNVSSDYSDIENSFKKYFKNSVRDFIPAAGITELLEYLKVHGIITGLGSGLTRDLFDIITENLGWDKNVFDYLRVTNETGGSRPNPGMIFDMMRTFGISGPELVIKTGDTTADILEGKNAGAVTAILISGTQERTMLEKENPDYIIESLSELKEIIY